MESTISLPPNEKSFEISLKGETTTQMWTGKFKCVCVPNLRQRSESSVLEKQLNGDLTTLDQETLAYHRMMAQLSSRLIAAPDWWIASNNGQSLLDLNVVFEVWKECMEAEKEWKDEVWKDKEEEEEKKLGKKKKKKELKSTSEGTAATE